MRVLSSLLLIAAAAAAACGDDGNVRHTPDAAADAPVIPDGPPQPVTVTVTRFGTPQEGVVVYFLNADSSLVKEMMTDATGTASTLMAAGGSVTALDPFRAQTPAGITQNDLYTWMAVKPGDHLILDEKSRPGITLNVIAPVDTTLQMPTYQFYSSCSYSTNGDSLSAAGGSDATAQGTISLYGCGTTADVLVVATGSNGATRYIYKANTPVADQGTIDLTTDAYVAAIDRAYTFSNAPGKNFIDVSDVLYTSHGPIWKGGTGATPSAPSTNLTVPAFPGAQSLVTASQFAPLGVSNRRELDWGPVSAAFTSDFGAKLLPELAEYPSSDVASRSISWTEAGGSAQPDLSYAVISTQRDTPLRFWQWFVTAPHATQIKLPTLPTDVFDFNFATGDSVYVDFVALVKAPGGYDAARPVMLSLFGPEDLVAGGSGSVSTTEMQQALRPAPKASNLPKPSTRGWHSKL